LASQINLYAHVGKLASQINLYAHVGKLASKINLYARSSSLKPAQKKRNRKFQNLGSQTKKNLNNRPQKKSTFSKGSEKTYDFFSSHHQSLVIAESYGGFLTYIWSILRFLLSENK